MENASSARFKCSANYIAHKTSRSGFGASTMNSGIGSFQALLVGQGSRHQELAFPACRAAQGGCFSATWKRERWRLLGDVEAALGGSGSEW